MSVQKTTIRRLAPDVRDAVCRALATKDHFHSTEKDAVPWLLLVFTGAVAGFIGSMATVSWDMVENGWRLGGGWINIVENNPELLGIVGGPLVALMVVWLGLYIHGRLGQLILPGAVAKIRGGRIIILSARDVRAIEVDTFQYGSDDRMQRRRQGASLKAVLKDGTTFTMLSASRPWLQKVREHLESAL